MDSGYTLWGCLVLGVLSGCSIGRRSRRTLVVVPDHHAVAVDAGQDNSACVLAEWAMREHIGTPRFIYDPKPCRIASGEIVGWAWWSQGYPLPFMTSWYIQEMQVQGWVLTALRDDGGAWCTLLFMSVTRVCFVRLVEQDGVLRHKIELLRRADGI